MTPPSPPTSGSPGTSRATGPQRSYLQTLAREAGEDVPDDLSNAQASELIDRLQGKSPVWPSPDRDGDHTVARERTESGARRIVADLNERIARINREPVTGSAPPLVPLDVELVLERWRERRG